MSESDKKINESNFNWPFIRLCIIALLCFVVLLFLYPSYRGLYDNPKSAGTLLPNHGEMTSYAAIELGHPTALGQQLLQFGDNDVYVGHRNHYFLRSDNIVLKQTSAEYNHDQDRFDADYIVCAENSCVPVLRMSPDLEARLQKSKLDKEKS